MILATVFGVSLVLQTSLSGTPRSSAERGEPVLALHQRDAAMLPLLHRATECIVRKVKGDPRFHAEL
ncbi:MAG: hypothetical protein JOZ70_01850, partial [Pseudolabrys sp.]|nr:hypothetical protein [Pseudolabrys sp.]